MAADVITIPATNETRSLSRSAAWRRTRTTALERINLTDLAVAASHADVRAVRDFESLILMPAAGRLERLEMERESRREVVQRVRIKLLTPSAGSPKIALYQGRGELQTWVAVVLLREAYTMMRSANREALAGGLDLLLLETTASERSWPR